MSVRIKVSYEHRRELEHVLQKLAPDVQRWKVAGRQEGRFKRAYIDLKLSGAKEGKNDNEPRANRGEK